MMHINSMPDLVLRLIFSRLSLQDLYNVGRVCLLWRSHQVNVRSVTLLLGGQSAQSLITNSRFTLKYRDLLLNDKGSRMSQHLSNWFHITYFGFSVNFSNELLKIFPNITTLEIAFKYSCLTAAMPLLVKWAPNLASLKMYFKERIRENELVDLLEVINSMSSLKHLTLVVPSFFHTYQPNLDLPIIGKLREFYFDFEYKNIEKSLIDYAVANDNLKQIGLTCVTNCFESFYRESPSLAGKIAHLPLLPPTDAIEMRNIVQSFTSLVYFYFYHPTSEHLLSGALNILRPLNQLTHLHLSVLNLDKLLSPDRISRDKISQLVSVQVLSITTYFKSIYFFKSDHWAHVFPSVQVIELNLNLTFSLKPKPIPGPLSEQQIQQSMSPFVQCPKLGHIFIHLRDNCRKVDYTDWLVLQVSQRNIVKVSK